MKRYANRNGHSGVLGFETGPDWIRVWFVNGSVYRYSAKTAGADAIAAMARLALSGEGLSTYISRCKPAYESRIG